VLASGSVAVALMLRPAGTRNWGVKEKHAGIVSFQNRRLHVAKLRCRGVLEDELKNHRLKQDLAAGHAGFESLRVGTMTWCSRWRWRAGPGSGIFWA
jgi:hypothetical protein